MGSFFSMNFSNDLVLTPTFSITLGVNSKQSYEYTM